MSATVTWEDSLQRITEKIVDATVDQFILDQQKYSERDKFHWNIVQLVNHTDKQYLWEFQIDTLENVELTRTPPIQIITIDPGEPNFVFLRESFRDQDPEYSINMIALRKYKEFTRSFDFGFPGTFPPLEFNGENIIHYYHPREYISKTKDQELVKYNVYPHRYDLGIDRKTYYLDNFSPRIAFFIFSNNTSTRFYSREHPGIFLDLVDEDDAYISSEINFTPNTLGNNVLMIFDEYIHLASPNFQNSTVEIRRWSQSMDYKYKQTVNEKLIGYPQGPQYIVTMILKEEESQYFLRIIDLNLKKAYYLPIWTQENSKVPNTDLASRSIDVEIELIENPVYLRNNYQKALFELHMLPQDLINTIIGYLL